MRKKAKSKQSLLSVGDINFKICNTKKAQSIIPLLAFMLMHFGICCYAEFVLFLELSFSVLLAFAAEYVIFHIIYTKIKGGFLKFTVATVVAVLAFIFLKTLVPSRQWSIILNRATMFINTAVRAEYYSEYADLVYRNMPYALAAISVVVGYIVSLIVYLTKNAYIYTLFAIGTTLLVLNARPYFCPVLGMMCVFAGTVIMISMCGVNGEFSALCKRKKALKNRKIAVLTGAYVRNAIGAICLVLGCAFIITTALPQENYSRIEDYCKERVEAVRVFFVGEDTYSENGEITDWTGFNEKIVMNKTISYDELKYDGVDVLKLTVPIEFTRPIYLRAFTGAVYENKSGSNGQWRGLTDEEYAQVNSIFVFPGYAGIVSRPYDYAVKSIKKDSNDERFYAGEIEITKEWTDDENSYQPYSIFANTTRSGFSLNYDSSISWQNNDSCKFYAADGTGYEWLRIYYNQNGELPKPDDANFLSTDRDYMVRVLPKYLETPSWLERSEVYELLDLPDDLKISDDRDYSEYSDMEILGLVDSVVYYLDGDFKYTTSPQASKSGEDTVYDFVFNSKEGYCMHFASAATLLLRSMGIPARYVSGFRVDPSRHVSMYSTRNNTITVTDSMAHAWTEVFFPGMGWTPIEVTKQSVEAGGNVLPTAGGADTPEHTVPPTPEITETPSMTPQLSDHPERSDLVPENTVSAPDTALPDLKTPKPNGEDSTSGNLSAVWWALAALTLIAATALFGFIMRKKRTVKYTCDENAALYIYEGLLALMRLKRVYISSFDIQTEIAQKLKGSDFKAFTGDIIRAYETAAARSFGGKMTSNSDLEFMLSLYKAVERYVFDNSGIFTKAYIRYWLHVK